MEKTDSIAIPAEFSSPPKKKFNPIENIRKNKKPLDLEETRTRLPKINRTVKCIICDADRILNPEQYQSYFDYWGDEEKLLRNFMCKPCDVQMTANPFKFWALNGELYKKLSRTLKTSFDLFNNSQKTSNDELNMTQSIISVLADANITASPNLLSNNHLEFIIENRVVKGMKIRTFHLSEQLTLPHMNPPKLQYLSLKYQSDNYPIKEVEDMSPTELSRWLAFCNFIKFTSLFCKKKGIKFSEMNWNYLDVLAYIDDTSGDIKTMLKTHSAIPRKYSLQIDDEESNDVGEISYA